MWAYDRPLYKAEYLADFLLENGDRIVEETLKHLTCQSKSVYPNQLILGQINWTIFNAVSPRLFEYGVFTTCQSPST